MFQLKVTYAYTFRSVTTNATSYLLDLLVDNDADSVLSYIVDTSRLTMVALVRHSLLNGTCALKRNHMQQCIIQQVTFIPLAATA